MDALLKQQETLKLKGVNRQVMILVDDIILSGKDEDALSHLCLRGRHFNISVMACAVSYTTLPKRCRRSLDVLFLFSCPMSGDCQILYRVRSQSPYGPILPAKPAYMDILSNGDAAKETEAVPLPRGAREYTGPNSRTVLFRSR